MKAFILKISVNQSVTASEVLENQIHIKNCFNIMEFIRIINVLVYTEDKKCMNNPKISREPPVDWMKN